VAEEIRCLLVDLDGTIYLGDRLIDGALRLKDVAEEKGIQVFFMTNNSVRM
jgi:4-nitrophenyl phosphatase